MKRIIGLLFGGLVLKIDTAETLLTRQLEWVKTADSKVAPIFAINAAMLGVMAALISEVKFEDISFELWCSAGPSAIALITSIVCLSLVVLPRTTGPDSIIFFGQIAALGRPDYLEKVEQTSDQEYLEDLLKQVHRNSEIVTEKYKFVRHSFQATFVSLVFWIFAVFFLYKLTSS